MSFLERDSANSPLRFAPVHPEYLELTEAPAAPRWRGGVFRRRKTEAKPLTAEQRLLRSAKRGDHAAFARIIELHQQTIFGYLRARVSDPTDAEDLAQEVFLRLYVGRAKFTGDIMLRPWLIGIARNLLREHARKLKRRKEVAWTELCIELEEMASADEPSCESALSLLPACIEALGQSARSALELRYQSKMRLAEIATRFKRSEGAVKLLMFRARQALKRCLDKKALELKSDD
jgi:RNA polymerase sigma-70 factor (ECF subfamily)